LHLDGKLDASAPAVVAQRINAATHAVLTATNMSPGSAGQQ